jgi:predicted Zn-dependent protease with MMP-like domain
MTLEQLTVHAADVVTALQKRLPPELRTLAASVPVHYEAGPDDDVLADGFEPDILGLFAGDPLGQPPEDGNPAPPQIILYVENLWDLADGDLKAFREEARLTYLHELGHYLGWDEDEVASRGLE